MKIIKERGVKVILKYLILSPLLEVVLKLLPYSPLRILFLNILGAKISYNAIIYNINLINYDIGSLKNLKIGKFAHIEPGILIDVYDRVDISDYASMGPNCTIISHSKAGNILEKFYPPKKIPIKIGKHSWVGSNTVVMADVGDEAIIGPGSVVNKNIPSNSIAVGVPAKVIRKTN
ncbi:MAG: acyltransferase [Nanoarchaeota archaeon]|nr:acyltransferase [Nanoarchaeota archaeon]